MNKRKFKTTSPIARGHVAELDQVEELEELDQVEELEELDQAAAPHPNQNPEGPQALLTVAEARLATARARLEAARSR